MARGARFVPGKVYRVPVDTETHVFARMLAADPQVAFYDLRTDAEDLDPVEAVRAPMLFVLAVEYSRAIRSGGWTEIGAVPLDLVDTPIPLQFMQSIGDPGRLSVLDHIGNQRPATREDCAGLERAAVWQMEHVQERLADHYAGRPNVSVDSQALR